MRLEKVKIPVGNHLVVTYNFLDLSQYLQITINQQLK